MAYRSLYTPLSQFVDPMSTEIAQELRAKYLTSFQAQDQVAQALAELPVAAFENDQKIYNDLYNSTRAQIDGLASRGDYENMFVPISRLARTYKNTATPLETNYNRYQADVEAKKEMLNKGEITMSDYEGWLKKSRLKQGTDDYTPYLGIELDDNGRAVQSSYYGGTPIAQYVDIQKEILTQLNQIPEVKRGGFEVKEIQAPDASGLVFAITKKGQIVEYVPQEAVDAVTANIMQRPDVQAYMMQSADFNTLDLDENELDAILGTAAQSYGASENKDEQRYGDQLAHIINTQTVGGKRRAVKAMLYNEDVNRYMTTARLTRQPSAYGGSYSESYESALTNKLNETRGGGGAGAYTPVLPGDNIVATNPHLIAEGQTAPTIAGVEGHIRNIGNNKGAVESALIELHPELADIYNIPTGRVSATDGEGIGAAVGSLAGANSFESIQDDLYKENGIEVVTTKLINANPDLAANKEQIENNLRQARASLFNYDAQRDAAEKIIKNAYGEFKDTFVNEVLADISNDIEMPAQQLPTFYNNPGLGQIGATYNPETNEVEFKQSGTFDPDAYKLGVAANIMTELEAEAETLSRSGLGGSLDVGAALFSQMFGLDAEEAMELAQAASNITVTGTDSIENLSQGMLFSGNFDAGYRGAAPVRSAASREDRLTGMTAVGSMGKINIREKLDKATEQAEERIGKLGQVTYTTSQSEAALGDSSGKLSKEINDTVKGRFLSTLGNVPVILTEPTRTKLEKTNPEIANQARAGVPGSIVTIADLYNTEKDEDYAKAKIARADFTSYLDPVTGSMKAGMSIETSTGDQILVPYDELIMGYDPTMPSRITNTYNSPGGMIASKAIATMLQYPTAFDEENGYVHREMIGGRSVEIEFLAPQMPLEEDGLAITAGPNRVIVRASGGAGEDVEQELPIDDFIIFYNTATQ